MTFRTKYATSQTGELNLQGSYGGYPAKCTACFKAQEGSGLILNDAVTGNQTSAWAASEVTGISWDSDKGIAMFNGLPAAETFTTPNIAASSDAVVIIVAEVLDTTFSVLWGAISFGGIGFKVTVGQVDWDNDVGLVSALAWGTNLTVGDTVAIYIRVDDSAATIDYGWVSTDSSDHVAGAACAGGATSTVTDSVQMTDCGLYGLHTFVYPEAMTPSLATVKAAAEWMLANHTSAEAKADPTKRIAYVGL